MVPGWPLTTLEKLAPVSALVSVIPPTARRPNETAWFTGRSDLLVDPEPGQDQRDDQQKLFRGHGWPPFDLLASNADVEREAESEQMKSQQDHQADTHQERYGDVRVAAYAGGGVVELAARERLVLGGAGVHAGRLPGVVADDVSERVCGRHVTAHRGRSRQPAGYSRSLTGWRHGAPGSSQPPTPSPPRH